MRTLLIDNYDSYTYNPARREIRRRFWQSIASAARPSAAATAVGVSQPADLDAASLAEY